MNGNSCLPSPPNFLRRSPCSLGDARTTAIWKGLLPTALPGIMIGVTPGVGRALAETAALFFTSGYSTQWPQSIKDSGRALSVDGERSLEGVCG